MKLIELTNDGLRKFELDHFKIAVDEEQIRISGATYMDCPV